MGNQEPRRDTFRYSLAVAMTVLLTVVAGSIGALRDTRELVALLAIENRQPISAVLSQHKLALEGSISFAAAILFCLLSALCLAIFAFERSVRLAHLQGKLDQRPDQLNQALQDYKKAIEASGIIFGNLYRKDVQRFRIKTIRESTTIAADGAGIVRREYLIEAGQEEAHCWRCEIFADDSATPIQLLSEVQFKARIVAGPPEHKLHYLLTSSESRQKEILIFFTPPARPGETRRFEISYNWPRFANDLERADKSRFHSRYRTLGEDDRAEVVYELRFSRALGELACEPRSLPERGEFVEDREINHWVWRYEHHAMKVRNTALELDVRRTGKPRR